MKVPHLFRLAFLLVSVFVAVSCGRNSNLHGGQGGEGEVVVVLNEEFQKGPAGQVIDEYLRDSYLLLPQHEPLFKLYVIPWTSFSNTFRAYRNIIRIDINPQYTEGSAKVVSNKGNALITFTAPDTETFVSLFKRHVDQIIKILSENEIEYAWSRIIKGYDKTIENQLLKKHNVGLKIPNGYSFRKDTTDFVFLSLDTDQMTLGLVIYYYNYTTQEQFKPESLLAKRDSVMRKHIMGPLYPKRMSFMTTTRNPIAPVSSVLQVNGQYTVEIRGLWHVTEDFMAGPFISHTRYDEPRRRLVTIEGFVYYPSENKRRYMRWFEAILRNVYFPETIATEKN